MSADEPVFEKTYLISVEAPLRLGMDDLGRLLEVVADAAYGWAETHQDRDWDLFIGGLPKDDATHSAEAAHDRTLTRIDELNSLVAKLWKNVIWAQEGLKNLSTDERELMTWAIDHAPAPEEEP